MNSWTVLLITVYHLLNSAMAWNPRSSLILVGKENYVDLKFPADVSLSLTYRTLVYYDIGHPVTYEYCPESSNQDKRLNFPKLYTVADYSNNRRPIKICFSEVEYDLAAPHGMLGQYLICHHDGKTGYKFEFVYRIFNYVLFQEKPIEIYNMCYNEDRKQIIVGSYTTHHPYLLRKDHLEDEQMFEFEFQTDPSPDHSNEYYFNSVRTLYQLYANSYLPRAVLPPELLAYALERKPFYNYMNLAPMKVELIGGWEVMMKNLKRRISLMHAPMKVTAGLITNQNSEYLGTIDGQQIDIPANWWVMITTSDDRQGIVIMMHNKRRVDAEGRPTPIDYHFKHCGPDYCSDANLNYPMLNILNYPTNLIYCCSPIVIKNQFNLNIGNRILRFPNEDVGPSS